MKQKTKFKISDVFHLAADKHLKSCSEQDNGKYQYSCSAIRSALHELLFETIKTNKTEFFILYGEHCKIIEQGLINMGLVNPNSVVYFKKFESQYLAPTEQSQGARYAWLKFCALMAEEQGV